MSSHQNPLAQLGTRPFICDGGLETTLIFHERYELPLFASFVLLDSADGRATLRRYYDSYAAIALSHGAGLVLDTPTWRANRDWGEQLGYDRAALARVNRDAVALIATVRDAWTTPASPMVLSGAVGPRGDGYVPSSRMSASEARDYHHEQLAAFETSGTDMATAFTLNYVDEAIGIVMAAQAVGLPAAIAFTVETDGRLPSGESLAEAILRTDDATDGYAAYYMINCAHPRHFQSTLARGGPWLQRLGGIRANASPKSHTELDECTELDIGNPAELAEHYRELRQLLPSLRLIGGCCGTDQRHIEAICQALLEPVAQE